MRLRKDLGRLESEAGTCGLEVQLRLTRMDIEKGQVQCCMLCPPECSVPMSQTQI